MACPGAKLVGSSTGGDVISLGSSMMGSDLELIREPVVASKFGLAHADAVVTVRNGILQDTVLALHLVTNIAVLLLRVDHDAWHFGPVNRRELHARSIITSKFSVERAAAVVSDDC